jgi:hypothetical protein
MNLLRHIPLLTLQALAAVAGLRAQDAPREALKAEISAHVHYQLVQPEEKNPETVRPEESNPFASELEAWGHDSEHHRVRERLLQLHAGGFTLQPDGRVTRMMLGDLLLEPGMLLPELFPGQRVQLRVHALTREMIGLRWIDAEASGLPPKPLLLPTGLKPAIRQILPGGLPGRPELHVRPAPGPAAPKPQL